MFDKLRLTRLQLLTGFWALAFVASIGCAESGDGFQRVPVKGKVTVDNQPLPGGVIRFLPESNVDGRNVEAIVTNGEYALDKLTGPVAGKHRVEIEATYHLAFRIDDEAAYANHVQTHGGLPANPIPPQFNRQSRLIADIPQAGSEELNFNLAVQGAR